MQTGKPKFFSHKTKSPSKRSTGFKKFGNIQQQNNFGLQSTQPRFPKQNNAFNKNLPHFSNGMSLEEEQQLQNNNQTNQNPFFGRQAKKILFLNF